MKIEKMKVSDLKYAPYNPRKIDDKELAKLKRSISEFGYVEPIVWNQRTGFVVGGNQRLKALRELEIEEVDVVVVDLDDAKEKALNVALNKISGEWDFPKLKDLLTDIDTGDFDIELTGFDLDEIADLITFDKEPEEDDFDADAAIEEIEEPKTKRGDIYLLGKHRLMCGDSTIKEDVERLMDGKKADMVFTDPPYGIDKEIKNDDLKGDEFIEWNSDWLSKIPTGTDAGFVCYHSTRTFPSLMIPAMESGWKFERMLWFHRPDKFPVHTWNGWMLTSQAILIFSKGEVEYKKVSPADQDYYRCTSKELTVHTGHPTEKIVSHLAKVMEHYAAELLYDPFGGSGSTLIACEQLNRTCYMMEIDERYCDVIVKRWEEYTGEKAQLMRK